MNCQSMVYGKSWIRALPRLVGGLTGLLLIWPLLWFFSGYLLTFLVARVQAYGYDLEPSIGGYREVIPLALLVLLPYGYLAFFVRPAIDKTFQRQLLTLVQGRTNQSAALPLMSPQSPPAG